VRWPWQRKPEPRPVDVEEELIRTVMGHLRASVKNGQDGYPTMAQMQMANAERALEVLKQYRASHRHLAAVPRKPGAA